MTTSEPKPYRWTIAEYRELGNAGLLPNIKTILIHGEIFDVPIAKPPHDCALSLASGSLWKQFSRGHHLRNQMSFEIGINNDPVPDLAVVRGAIREFSVRNPTTADLIVEVAHSSGTRDMGAKYAAYERTGVREYIVWRVDDYAIDWFQLRNGRLIFPADLTKGRKERSVPLPKELFDSLDRFKGATWLWENYLAGLLAACRRP